MKILGMAMVFLLAMAAAVVLFSVFPRSSSTADTVSAGLPIRTPEAPTPQPTPEPKTWIDGLATSRHGVAVLTSCLDANGDGTLNRDDSSDFGGLEIPLLDQFTCIDPAHHRDFYAGDPSDTATYSCGAAQPPALIVAIGSAGTDLFDSTQGESLGVLDVVNALQRRAQDDHIATVPLLSTSAIFGAEMPQTRNEEWIAHEVARRLDAMPCLRAVLIGHSHGAAAVTSVAATLDDRYGDRVYGVLIDRTTILYDRDATELPTKIPLLNEFQTNEGWHGNVFGQANITNADESGERAPVAPSDGGGGLALVSHKTLDDSVAVQHHIEDAVMAWLTRDSESAPSTGSPSP